jgi:hypothetical protein
MPISPSKLRDLADENNKILTEWKRFETTVLFSIVSSVMSELTRLQFLSVAPHESATRNTLLGP